jgi:hypothetical protein
VAAKRNSTQRSTVITTRCCALYSRHRIRSRSSTRWRTSVGDQQDTLDANEVAYHLAEERYAAGLASYLTVLNAETQVLSARQNMVDILTSAGEYTHHAAARGGRQLRSPHGRRGSRERECIVPRNSSLTQSKP